ncbi:Uncharacterised protein [Citrobacter koseri]|uniref:Uncharacterized protein n=1 Tax=Citrobacter koseri TaxID=545 RepID=A0A2X2WFC5_CITKO|nr:Uncharacterised protein [Citrobacter koseri]
MRRNASSRARTLFLLIPDAGRAALAAGGEAAKKVEIPGVATTASPSAEVGRFFETQSSKGGRYTVTLPDGTKVEELNKATAAMMVPFDSIKFTGNYGNMTEVSYQVAKRAAEERREILSHYPPVAGTW